MAFSQLILLGLFGLAAQPQTHENQTQKWCAASHRNMVDTIVEDIIPQVEARLVFTKFLTQTKNTECHKALNLYFDNMLQKADYSKDMKKEGAKPLLVIGLAAHIPAAVKIVESEILNGQSEEWLPTMEQANPSLYKKTLKLWATSMATELRSQRETQKTRSPLIIDRYFRLLGKNGLDDADFKNINALYAASTASYRATYESILKSLLRANDSRWLPSTRNELPWIQVRLIGLMTQVGGPEVVRELMWISDANPDTRIRVLANSSLEEMMGKNKR